MLDGPLFLFCCCCWLFIRCCRSASRSLYFSLRDLFRRWRQSSGKWVNVGGFVIWFFIRFFIWLFLFHWVKLQITDRKPLPLSSLTVWNVCFLLSLVTFTLRIFVRGFMWFADELFQFAHHVFTVGSLSAYSILVTCFNHFPFHMRIARSVCTSSLTPQTRVLATKRWCPRNQQMTVMNIK